MEKEKPLWLYSLGVGKPIKINYVWCFSPNSSTCQETAKLPFSFTSNTSQVQELVNEGTMQGAENDIIEGHHGERQIRRYKMFQWKVKI